MGYIDTNKENEAQEKSSKSKKPGGKIIYVVLFLTGILTAFVVHSFTNRDEGPGPSFAPEPAQTAVSSQAENTYTILLDSGHSRTSPGAQGLVSEEAITEKTTEYLRLLFENDSNYHTVLTHNYDADVSTTERREIAIENNADFFISIHCNANEDSNNISGFEVYVQPPENANHAISHSVASLIANGFVENGHTPRKETGLFYCRYEEDRRGNTVQYTLTEEEEENTDYTGDTFGVLNSELYPAILVEQGYVTSEQDTSIWMSDEGCQRAAEIYYRAICTYFGTTAIIEG